MNPRFCAETLKEYAAIAAESDSHITVDTFYNDLAGNVWAGPIVLAIFISILRHCTDRHIANFGMAPKETESDDGSPCDALADVLAM